MTSPGRFRRKYTPESPGRVYFPGVRVVIVTLCLLLAGCTSTIESVPVPDPAFPADRDEPAVLAALHLVDPCSLVDGEAVALGPHRCQVRSGPHEFRVHVGARLYEDTRIRRYYPKALGGAKAYLERYDTTSCAGHLPVSFELSIRFDVLRGPCAAVGAVIGQAARRLADPSPSTLPMAGYDPCTMLAAALPESLDYQVGRNHGGEYAMDGCVAAEEVPTDVPVVRLHLTYGPAPDTDDTIGGMPVEVGRVGVRCQVRWSNGSVGANEQLITVLAPECDLAREIAHGVSRSTPEPEPVDPRRPLLYRPDEPDMARLGACAYVGHDCRPHTGGELPAERADIPAAAERDADIACTIARDAVRERFGNALDEPVTTSSQCVFTEATRTVEVAVSFGSAPGEGYRPQGTRSEVAGLEAWTEELSADRVYRTTDVVLPGGQRLLVGVRVDVPPGAKRTDRPDLAPLAHLPGIVEDIVTTYLV
jgi:hypothetical protein